MKKRSFVIVGAQQAAPVGQRAQLAAPLQWNSGSQIDLSIWMNVACK